MNFNDLVDEVLHNSPEEVKIKILDELKDVGHDLLVDKVSKSVAHVLLKAIDGVIAAVVKVLDTPDTMRVADGYVSKVQLQLMDLEEAIYQYVPLQVAVEEAKHKFGNDSKEANEARKLRVAGISEIREEVSDIFAAVAGVSVVD